jgi:hypothetical protein
VELAVTRRAIVLVAALVLGSHAASRAEAQQGDARALFEQASEALDTGRFAEARDLLRRSLDLTPNPATAFNLAVALRGTGETLASVSTFDDLLGGRYGRISGSQRAEAGRLRAQTRAEVAVLHIVARGADRIEVRVDGRRIGVLEDGERRAHEVDPGPRVVTASAPRRETVERRLELARGSSERVELELLPSGSGELVVEAIYPEDVLEIVGVGRATGTLRREVPPGDYEVVVSGPAGRRESLVTVEPGQTLRVRLERERASAWTSPWLWTGVGAAVAGLIVAGVLLLGDRVEDPIQDPVYGVVAALRAGGR